MQPTIRIVELKFVLLRAAGQTREMRRTIDPCHGRISPVAFGSETVAFGSVQRIRLARRLGTELVFDEGFVRRSLGC